MSLRFLLLLFCWIEFLFAGVTSLELAGQTWLQVGRGTIKQEGPKNVLLKDALLHSEQRYKNMIMRFKARSNVNEDQVQIWCGFGFRDREHRYALGLRGGPHDDLYLVRYGPLGRDSLLALVPLDFHPVPGQWYTVTILTLQNQIAVFLENEERPRLLVRDKSGLDSGQVVLGGGWLPTQFKLLQLEELTAAEEEKWQKRTAAGPIPVKAFQQAGQEQQSRDLRTYRPQVIHLQNLPLQRISLNGDWLFNPDYQAIGQWQPDWPTQDRRLHRLPVPAFWRPVRNWLHLQDSGLPHPGSGVSDNYWQKELTRCAQFTFDYQKTDGGTYFHWLDLPQLPPDRRFVLQFDAVAKVCRLFVNGHFVGQHVGMFAPFSFDITPYLHSGRNVLALHVQTRFKVREANADQVVGRAVSVDITNDMLNSLPYDMFSGEEGGIWQPVTLLVTGPLTIEEIQSLCDTSRARFKLQLANSGQENQQVALDLKIMDHKSKETLFTKKGAIVCQLPASETVEVEFVSPPLNPQTWSPEKPHLYDFIFQLRQEDQLVDCDTLIGAFRTFEAKGNRFYLNGRPYWLRGANHPPIGIAPNDKALAAQFLQLMHDNNQMITRSHGCPATETWLKVADSIGVGFSFEGIWPWLMIDAIPDSSLLNFWKAEMLALIKKYRNHPSLLIWTMNNEMYFTMFNHNKPLPVRLRKWQILSDVIKQVRKLDPTRPISCDSGYDRLPQDYRQNLAPLGIDDGGIDDRHIYPGWYNRDFYQFMNGEWAQRIYWSPGANPDRPFFSQEASTGYPNNDSGHPTRKYLFKHYVPQAWIGDWAWEDHDPAYFLKRHAFLTRGLAEVVRRTSPQSAGLLLFANVCWFRNVFDAQTIEPYPVVEEVKKAFAPVLLSLELTGWHYFTDDTLKCRLYLVNNDTHGRNLPGGVIHWQWLVNDKLVGKGRTSAPAVPFNEIKSMAFSVPLPNSFDQPRVQAQLSLKLEVGGQIISKTDYELTLFDRTFLPLNDLPRLALYDPLGDTKKVFDGLGIHYLELKDLTEIRLRRYDVLVVANLDKLPEVPYNWEDVRNMAANGRLVLLIHPGKHAAWLLPDYVQDIYERQGRVINMRIPESTVFDGLEIDELAWWQDGTRSIPYTCRRSFRFKKQKQVEALATYLRPHVYLSNPQEQLKEMSGVPLAQIPLGKGRLILCEMEVNKALNEPLAARLLINMLKSFRPGEN